MPSPSPPQTDEKKLYTAIVVPVEPVDEASFKNIMMLMNYFSKIANEMIRRILNREKFEYQEYKGDFHTMVAQKAKKIAIELVKSYRELCRLYKQGIIEEEPSEPEIKKPFARLAKQQIKFKMIKNELILRVAVKPWKCYAYLKVLITNQLKLFVPLLLELNKNRGIIGEPTIFCRGRRLFLSIPIKVPERPTITVPGSIIPIDYNENSIDLLLVTGNKAAIIRLFTHLSALKEKYADIRGKIDSAYKKSDKKTKRRRRLRYLLRKYGARESNRVEEITRYAVQTIIGLAWLTGATVIREFLKYFKSIPGLGLLSYRLSSLPHAVFRNILDLKAVQHGVKLIKLDEKETKNTSKECPGCGRTAKRIGTEKAKCKCGCEFNPQISAPFIIAKRKSLIRIIKWPKKL